MDLNISIKMLYNIRLFLDGLEHTRNWLLQHINTTEPVSKDVDYDTFIRTCLKKAFTSACIDMLDWDRSSVNWVYITSSSIYTLSIIQEQSLSRDFHSG